MKRIAVFHNYMDNIGGAERVGLTLAQGLGADIYATVANRDAIRRMGFDVHVKTFGWVPANAPWRQQMASWRFSRLDVADKYDAFVIDGDWAVSAAPRHKPNVWYVHSPIREIWDLYDFTREHQVRSLGRPLFDAWAQYNRRLNREHVRHVNRIVCNSLNTQQRVRRFLGREADIVHPPIETSQFHYKKNGPFWLSVNRLVAHKRVDLQMRAFARMPQERLVIVGSHENSRHVQEYTRYLRSIKPDNVMLLEQVPFSMLVELYAHCKGFITTSHNEDFGMTPVEAMASGKPVIAPNEGGYKESVLDGKTGTLIDGISPEKIAAAVDRIGGSAQSYRRACERNAARFDTQIFLKKMMRYVA